jgi:hypothetical protein
MDIGHEIQIVAVENAVCTHDLSDPGQTLVARATLCPAGQLALARI